MRYVSLHTHTTFSYGDGFGTVDDHVKRVSELEMSAVALTEHGNTSSHAQLEKAGAKYNVKPIYGCELYTAPTDPETGGLLRTRRKFHQTVLAKDQEGYRNLNRIVTESWRGFFQWPTASARSIKEHSRGLVVLSGCADSLLSCTLLGGKTMGDKRDAFSEGDFKKAVQVVRRYQDIFGEDYYLETQRFPGLARTRTLNPAFAEISRITGARLVASSDVHYPYPDQNEMQRILHAAHRGGTVESVDAEWEYDILLTYPTSDQEIFRDLIDTGLTNKDAREAILNTERIAEKCNVTLPKNEPIKFPYPGSGLHGEKNTLSAESAKKFENIKEYIYDRLREGWEFRKIDNRRNVGEYRERLAYEMGQIESKGFLDYFGMLSDAVTWAKSNKIPVGPARGSAAASLACYLLRITEIDPIQFPTMLFARFIDPNRLDLPDVDLDFADDRRHEVREYLVSVYGEDRVGNIGNFMRYRGKNSIDDIARVYRIPKWAAETVKGLIVERSGGDARQSESLEDTFAMFPKAREMVEQFPELKLATKLEGNYRGIGIHAAGIVLSNEPISETCAMYTRDGKTVIAYDKKDSEYVGMLKADFLGLSTMGVIGRAIDMIGMDLEDLYRIPITESDTLRAFRENNLIGIFQFEGRATAIINRDVEPENFGHLADINALSRPGPLFSGMTAKYVAVKHGREDPERLHPVVDALTGWTYGQIVYQEQVLSIVKDLAGFPIERVGDIRRIISQKLGQMAMANALEEFIEGCKKTHNIQPELAKKIWNFIATSSTYSFCVTGDTVLERGGAGKHDPSPEVTAEQLWLNANDRSLKGRALSGKIRAGKLKLKSMSDDGRIRLDNLKKITKVDEYQCSKITTATGRSITVSNDHPILTSEGYKTPHELQPGHLAVVDLGKEAREQEKQDLRRSGVGSGWATGKTWVNGQRMEIDGRSRLLSEAKIVVRERSGGACEHCGREDTGEKHCLEFAHVLQLNDCDGIYHKYHDPANILHLCNSCHKTFDWRMQRSRKPRWSFGNPTGFEEITSIEPAGIHAVYDLEMEGDQHNYIGNGFVNHNNQSHSVSYAMLAFWSMYLKVHYPKEFYAASLQRVGGGKQDLWKRTRLILDAKKNDIAVLPPSLSRSSQSWSVVPDGILGGFEQVPGIGPKTSKTLQGVMNGTLCICGHPNHSDLCPVISPWGETTRSCKCVLSTSIDREKGWSEVSKIAGIGKSTVAKIESFVNDPDPYQVNRVGRVLEQARGYVAANGYMQPTHHSTKTVSDWGLDPMPNVGDHDVVWIGMVRNMNFKDVVEATRTRTGLEEEEIMRDLKDPHLRKSCVLQSYDDGDEDVYVRVSRWMYPEMEEDIAEIVKDQDVILVWGKKREDFGISIHARGLVVFRGED